MSLLDPRDASASARDALDLWLSVQHHLAFRPLEATYWLAKLGDPARALRASEGRRLGARQLARARQLLERHAALGLGFGSPAYPERLRHLMDAPPLLWLRGEPSLLSARAVAIVGSRAATGFGRELAHELAAGLARAGRVVISGLARGIDAAAHRGALEAGGPTLAVLGCGIDRIYPADHHALAEAMLAGGGALLSEFFPGTSPRPAHFPLRNRLISALAEAVIVVEARARSGSLVTARLALDQGIEVLAVPGAIDAPNSRGTNALLYDGAVPLLGVAEALRELGCAPPEPPPRPRRATDPVEATPELRVPAAAPAPLGEDARAVLIALLEEPASTDELARRLDRPVASLAAALLELELAGRISEERDGRWLGLAAPAR